MKKLKMKKIISTFLGDRVLADKAILVVVLWSILSIESAASQEKITGLNLTKLVIGRLNEEGLSGQPIINKNRVFSGCESEKIKISKRDNSWKTITLTCKTNTSWNYTFRNKLAKSTERTKLNQLQNTVTDKTNQSTEWVFILKNPKSKGDKIEKTDIILSQKKTIFTKGAFSDLNNVLGKRLGKSLRKGAILKANYLKPEWLVHKNQRIIIEHNVGKVNVKMEGIALNNGVKGDRILAKNVSTNKTIEGFVESAKKISIFRKIY